MIKIFKSICSIVLLSIITFSNSVARFDFLSLKLILVLTFFINNPIRKKNGIRITICLKRKIRGN